MGESTEKCITFSVPIYKENDDSKTITYRLRFIDSYRFMSASLSDLVNNVSEINNKDCKIYMEKKILNRDVILSNLKIID